jgi:hypothetical protein
MQWVLLVDIALRRRKWIVPQRRVGRRFRRCGRSGRTVTTVRWAVRTSMMWTITG